MTRSRAFANKPDVAARPDRRSILQFGSFLRVMIAASITVSRLSWIPGTRPLARHPRGWRTSARIRSKIRHAVRRCFRGAFRSDCRIGSINVAAAAITAPYFLATKLEAFQGRGKGDVFASHDLEDVIAVIDGRPAITEEIQAADARVRAFISRNIAELLADRRFMDAGYLLPDAANQGRLGQLQSVLRALSLFERQGRRPRTQ
jgi:hypothetical protein